MREWELWGPGAVAAMLCYAMRSKTGDGRAGVDLPANELWEDVVKKACGLRAEDKWGGRGAKKRNSNGGGSQREKRSGSGEGGKHLYVRTD